MRTTLALALIVTLLGVGASSTGTRAPAPATSTASTAQVSLAASGTRARKERRVIALTNIRRKRHGCRPLRGRPALREAARRHSWRMARHQTMSHRLAGEPRLGVRVRRAGYTRWTLIGENIAYGYRTPRALVRAWMRSPGHRRNILDCRLRHLGVGLVWRNGVPWWTQDLGRRRG